MSLNRCTDTIMYNPPLVLSFVTHSFFSVFPASHLLDSFVEWFKGKEFTINPPQRGGGCDKSYGLTLGVGILQRAGLTTDTHWTSKPGTQPTPTPTFSTVPCDNTLTLTLTPRPPSPFSLCIGLWIQQHNVHTGWWFKHSTFTFFITARCNCQSNSGEMPTGCWPIYCTTHLCCDDRHIWLSRTVFREALTECASLFFLWKVDGQHESKQLFQIWRT